MIKGQDLKLEPIRFQNHSKKDEKLEALIFQANDILYFLSRKIISPQAKEYLLTNFEQIGRQANELEDTPRKTEFVTALRHHYKSVRNADIKLNPVTDIDEYQKLLKYCIAKSVKAKSGTYEDILKQLEENKLVHSLYVKPFQAATGKGYRLYTENFDKIQSELLQLLGRKYSFENYDE